MPVANRVAEIISERIGRSAGVADTFQSLGVDSLDYLDVVSAVERDFGVRLDDGEVVKVRTVGDLAALVSREAVPR